MNDKPLVSVVIPAYKTQYFDAALASACRQTYRPLEIVVCDDSRTDVIGALVRHYQETTDVSIRYVFNEHQRGELFNAIECIKVASGKYVKFLHDDDVLHPDCVAELAAAMDGDPSISLASSRRRIVGPDGAQLPDNIATAFPFTTDVVINGPQLTSFLGEHTLNFIGEPSCVLCRREDLLALGDDLMSLNGCLIYWVGDLAMYVKLLQKGNLALLKQPLTDFRVSPEQGSQLGRDQPGIGNQGHADFKRTLRELGWSRAGPDNRLVSVSLLNGEGVIEQVDILQQLQVSYARELSAQQQRHWIAARVPSPVQHQMIERYLQASGGGPLIGVIVLDLLGETQALMRTLQSLTAEHNFYGALKVLVLTPDASAQASTDEKLHFIPLQSDYVAQINQLLRQEAFEWCLLAKAGDEFTRSGLLIAGLELLPDSDCRAVFCDGVLRHNDGDFGVTLRPDFNLDYLLSFPAAMAHNWIFRRGVVLEAGGFDATFPQALEFELILRLINQGGIAGFGHVSEPLLISQPQVFRENEDERRAIAEHLKLRGYERSRINSSRPGQYQIDYGHELQPLVSIVLVMNDELAAVQRCIFSILEHTLHPYYEVLIVDNASQSDEARQWLQAIEEISGNRIRVLGLTHAVDRSTANNIGAQHAEGEYLLFLRSYAAILQGQWLGELLNHSQRPEVGIVGAKTLSSDSRITHAGLILGLQGAAASAFAGEHIDAAGYMNRLLVDQGCSAVSDACLMVRKALFEGVGGLDAEHFPESGADIDLCLRVAEQGYLTVWTPRALVMHSVPAEPRGEAVEEALYERWIPVLARDPAYNLNFSLMQGSDGFQLADPQLCWRPLVWRPVPTVLVHPADRGGCGQYRVIQPFNAQKNAGLIDGVQSDVFLPLTELERLATDAIIFQRQISEAQLNNMRRVQTFSKAFKVLELDDYLPNLPLKSIHQGQMPKDIVRTLRRALSYVDRFVVSTGTLAEALGDFHPDIRVMENRLDPRWWGALPVSQRRVSAKPRVGWAGGNSHTGDLELIGDVVKALANEVDWVFFGMCPDNLRPYVKEFHSGVEISLYPAALASLNLDLAVAPVEQNLFNECKSNLRLLEYGACGYPVVCSDLVCYQGDLPVTRVRNRFKDWVKAIRMHLADLDATARAGDALREAVRRDWMLDDDAVLSWRKVWLPD
ncbi:glycosyltransferase [Pseudomonas putida]|uniref:Glycosyltransferase n=1 Tax=Pseudomonas putida TaxID=303 RepID=A0A2Z4RKW3_PSEPU|nr:glycosyltransferase [Pseudomonas putida]AWY40664.1 glycosyltransferase [Pseudomonas putida]